MDAPLNFNKKRSDAFDQERAEAPEELDGLLEIAERLTGFVRRQFPIFIFVTTCCLAVGLLYLLTAPPIYASHAMLLIDSSKLRFLQEKQTPVADVPIDTTQVETQVEILKSENIGLAVIKELKLTQDPEFVGSGGGLPGWFFAHLGPSEDQSETTLERRALASFLNKRSITRVERTYVLDIGFTSLNGARAATIANAIADAYIVDQLEAKYQATKRASVWLQDRIKELRQQASDADRVVLDYKEKNKIVSVGGSASGPRLLGEQQLEDLNTQLGTARAAAEEAKARLERINDVMERDLPDAAVADSLHSEVINRLRNNYLDIAAKEAIWSGRYGSGHLAAVNLRTQMSELRRAIHDELGRIAESYKSDYEISKTRVDGLERELQRLVASSQVTNRDRLGLTDLESTAKVYHSIYDNFLQRYMEAIQQQSFPITEARVISLAAPPDHKSAPRGSVVLGFAGVIGLVLSFGAAALRDTFDRVFRTVRQVEASLHARCLAILPLLSVPNAPKNKHSAVFQFFGDTRTAPPLDPSAEISPGGQRSGPRVKIGSKASQIAELEPSRISSTRNSSIERRLVSGRPFMRQVVDEPLSAFAEAFRSIKVAADISGSRVIGITSTVPGEGKSTVSSNLAELMAHTGKRVILLDGDLRNPSLTRALAANSNAGLIDVLSGEMTLDKAMYTDEVTGLRFVPAVNSCIAYSSEILASDLFKAFVDGLRKDYDYIIIDFPPIAPIVDVRTTFDLIDSYIYVIEWGRTGVGLVQHQLSRSSGLYDRLLGVVLNKADVRILQRYDAHHYGKQYYGQYPYA
jgi:capsular exopolysaccharide synthesis family protein